MKIEIDAEPEELPKLIKLLVAQGAVFTVSSPGREAASEAASALPAEIAEHMRATALPEVRGLFTRFVEREISERDASAKLGSEATKYIRLYVPGPQRVGAYAYVRPDRGYIDFRLPDSALADCTFAYRRGVQTDHAYSVRMPLAKPQALAEAHRLAQLAARRASAT